VTLRSFSKVDGSLIWQHWLDNPVLSSDGFIYGYAYELDDSAAANSSHMVPLSGAGAGGPVRVARTTSVKRYKKWIRKLDTSGNVIGDSTFFWYTGNGAYGETPLELPSISGATHGWMQDVLGATADGELLQQSGNFSAGTTLSEYLIAWDSNNTTTTRKYTFVAAAVRDLATPPTGGVKMRFVAENDGTNAQQTIDVPNMIGITASALATAVAAFPHVASASGTGGPYPLQNIELTIVWNQSTTHFLEVSRLTSTSRGVRTWLRDWDTAEITATLVDTSPVNSSATVWQLDASDNIIGHGTNGSAVVGGVDGIGIEKFTRSGASYSQAWRVRPTEARGPIWGPAGRTRCLYYRPAIRGGKLIVGHDNGRGADQTTGQSSEWHEIDLAAGTLTTNGGINGAIHGRVTFATDSKLLALGWDSFMTNSYDGTIYQCDRAAPNPISLMTDFTGYDADYFGAYGQEFIGAGSPVAADGSAIYGCRGFAPGSPAGSGGWSANSQKVIRSSNQALATIYTRFKQGDVSQVSADSFFGQASYYRIQYILQSPINHRWVDAGMQWRAAFFGADNPTASDDPTSFTAWLDFDDDETDFLNALLTLLGNNTYGPNAYVAGPDYAQGSDEPIPEMIWQRGMMVTLPARSTASPYGINVRNDVRYMYIQVKAATANAFTLSNGYVNRVDWDTGDVIWNIPFGQNVAGGADIIGRTGVIIGDQYVVAGDLVSGSCFALYEWQNVGSEYAPEYAWALVSDYCASTKTATAPDTDGDYPGERRYGTCA
jgi:hypothetical protein